jgi:hypothetical protein
MKKDYEDDPEEYWNEIRERKEERGRERLSEWEKRNPNQVYGGNTFNFGDNE